MNFVRVIPMLRTPLGIEGFDYRLPQGESYKRGDLVMVPFRQRNLVGIVSHLIASSAFASKTLPVKGRYANLSLPSTFVDLVEATARRTFCSSASVLKSWLRELPKQPAAIQAVPKTTAITGLSAHWNQDYTTQLIKAADAHRQTQRVLIVTPWIKRASWLHEQLPNSALLHSELNAGQAFQAWTTFLAHEQGCLITSKIGAWLATCSDIALLDEPEQDDHKQDELTPRYDARKVLLWCAQQKLTQVKSFGLTPPLHSDSQAPALDTKVQIFVHHPKGRSDIPCLQSDALEAFLSHAGPRLIVHPIRGSLARITCRDCSWQALCPNCQNPLSIEENQGLCRRCYQRSDLPMSCPVCQGADLGKSLPGIQRLEKYWQKTYPSKAVDWRDTTNEQLEASLPFNCVLLLTDVGLLASGEDVRRRERQCYMLRRLINRVGEVGGSVILQCREDLAPLMHDWLTTEGMANFMGQERGERRTFGYPPSTRVVKIIFRGGFEIAQAWQAKVSTALQQSAIKTHLWRGPWAVAHLPSTRGIRTILHLVLPPDTPENNLIECLRSCARPGIIIDLDPVSFLR